MQPREGRFKGQNNLSIYWQAWLPSGKPRALVVIAHGVAEHSGRYARVAKVLVDQGYAVYAIDHRGHGKSEGERAYIEKFDFTVSDLDQLVLLATEQQPGAGKPFLIGHSLGGAISLSYALKFQGRLRGLILSGAAVQLNPIPFKIVFLARLFSLFSPKKPFLPIDGGTVSRDPDEVRKYNEDPLNSRTPIPARTLVELLDRIAWLPATYSALSLPLLVMHGTADALALVAGGKRIHDEAGAKDKTLKLYEGYYHEIFNEPPADRDRVYADLLAWIAARVHT
ncbi:MAG: lysophospholipase [Panacagrimonas sp.]